MLSFWRSATSTWRGAARATGYERSANAGVPAMADDWIVDGSTSSAGLANEFRLKVGATITVGGPSSERSLGVRRSAAYEASSG